MAIREIYEKTFDEDVQPTRNQDSCPECNGTLDPTGTETTCTECGLVVTEHTIDHGPEWRTFEDSDGTEERTGAPRTPARHDHGLSTTIGSKTDGYGDPISGDKRRKFNRLRRYHSRNKYQSTAEQNLIHAFVEIRRMASALGLSNDVRDRACTIFRTAQHEGLLPGRSIEGVAAASIYAACRCRGLPRTFTEVSDYAPDEVNVRNAYQVLNLELGLEAQPPTPTTFVSRYASELNVPASVRKRALDLAAQAVEAERVMGHKPAAFAASCLYVAASKQNVSLTQAELSDVADVSPVTIRNHREVLADLQQ